MNTTVSDILSLFSDPAFQSVTICDLKDGGAENVYQGTIDDMPHTYDGNEVCSIDTIDESANITLNIDTSK